MRRMGFFILLALLFLAAGCGSPPVPDWKLEGFNALESYKKYYLEGEDGKADFHFQRAIDEFRKSGDLDLLDRVLLTRCALRRASLEAFSGEDCLLPDRSHTEENETYLSFLQGNLDESDPSRLPGVYREFLKALREKQVERINETIGTMNDPLSRIIASAVALKVGTWNEATLQQAFQAASREGWKRIVLVYLETLESYYGEKGNPEKARQVRRQIELLTVPLK